MFESNETDCNLKSSDWKILIHAINQKNCILMLGPDIATETIDKKTSLLTESLANQLAMELDQKTLEEINSSDLAQVAQHYEIEMETLRNILEDEVISFYKKKQDRCSKLHENLAALPFYFTITTTPDSMFLNALLRENKQPIVEYYNFNGENPSIVQMGQKHTPLVYYLYGSIKEAESLLLTENDLLDFLAGLMSGKRPLPENIQSELKNENKIFLFMGFGFRHWYLRLLLHVLQGGSKKKRRSFALEKKTLESTNELKNAVFFFKKTDYRIHIFDEDYNKFAETLRKRVNNCTPDIAAEIEAENKPEVFICHASEDRNYAASLYKEFEQAGICPWLDKENLRGGEHWDSKIKETIKKIDYFVVLQSHALNNKDRSYVTREINRAIDRLEEFPRGGMYVFLIIVKIEACPIRKDLDDLGLQIIDLTHKENMKKLIDIIQRDFQKRKNRNK